MDGFKFAGATVPGMDHIMPGECGWKNNQDSFRWHASPTHLIAVVTDGCSSHPHSEVGATLGAQIIVNHAAGLLEPASRTFGLADIATKAFFGVLMRYTLDSINAITDQIGGSYTDAIEDQFFFSTVGVIMTPLATVVFSCGDGVYAVNGAIGVLGPYPGNEPPYLAYNLAPRKSGGEPVFEINEVRETKNVHSVLIGTDGVSDLMKAEELLMPIGKKPVGPLSQFWKNDLFFSNSDALRRQLAKCNCETVEGGRIKKGLFKDDTTLIAIRRTPTAEGVANA